jgi:hypothetical protein
MKFMDKSNRPRTESLFLETCRPKTARKYEPVYTLRSYERNGLPSAYQIYMDSINEYEAAIRLVGDMRHWRKLCSLKWFMDGVEEQQFDGLAQWRVDKAAKDQAEALYLLKQNAEGGNVTAQRTLLDAAKQAKEVGRPKKEKEVKAAKEEREAKVLDLLKLIKSKQAE